MQNQMTSYDSRKRTEAKFSLFRVQSWNQFSLPSNVRLDSYSTSSYLSLREELAFYTA